MKSPVPYSREEPTRRHERYELWLLVVIALLMRATFMYRAGAPEPDTMAMVAGMAMGMSGNMSPGDALLYGRNVNPGMHMLAVRIFPLLFSPQHLLAVLNWLTVACASLTLVPFYALIRPYLTHRVALSCLLIWIFAPIVWESGTYYHPLIPAMFLLLLALVVARHIGTTMRGILAFILTTLLTSLALLVRVEVVFIWPGLLAWTAGSRRRWRDMSIFLAVSVISASAFLLASRVVTSSAAGPSAANFVKTTSGLYTSTFNLQGLPRSTTWMVLGMGISTLAACAWGLMRRPLGNARLLVAAMAWSLPSMIFWLPQPTPINRHYLLATAGMVVVLGVLALSRPGARRVMAIAFAVAAINLLVPDIAYRVYNSRNPQTPKTAHGSFFYYHTIASREIARDAQVARRIATCTTSGALDESPRSCALVRWEVFAHVAYALSASGRRVVPEPVASVFPGVRDVRFQVDHGEVRLIIYSYFEDPVLRHRVSGILNESQRDGYCLFAPGSLIARVPELKMFPMQGY